MANRVVQALYDLKDNVTAKLKKIGDAWKGSEKDSDKAAAGIDKNNKLLSASFTKLSNGIGQFRAALAAVAGFVGLTKLKDGLLEVLNTGERFDDIRKQFDAVFGSVEAGGAALDGIRKLAEQVPDGFEDVTAAAIQLRKLGFDPLDGTLQALIDNNAALDGSQQDLMATIDALGKANLRGEVGMRALVSLTERGIPVFDLLGKATGKTAEEVRQLANDGKLGADTVKLLVTELGNLRAGAAAAEMGDLDAQFQKIKDSASAFLNEISQAGALEYFQGQIAALTQRVREMAASGELQSFAKKISDAIVGTAEAVKRAGAFVIEYSGTLLQLAKSYAAIKVAGFLVSMAQSAAAMLAAGVAAKNAAGQMGGLRGAMKAIPANVKIAVAAVGIELAIDQWRTLAQDIKASSEIESEALRVSSETAAQRNANAEKMRAIIQLYADYRSVAILSEEAVKEATEKELQAYNERLENARKYFAAVAVERRKANDPEGEAEARRRVEEYNAALAETAKRLAEIAKNREAAFAKTEGENAAIAALRELGVSAQVSGVQITEAGKKIIANLQLVATEATVTGDQFKAAFSKSIDSAQTIAEVDKMRAALRVAFESGKIGAEEYAALAKLAAERTKTITAEADKATGALAGMGDGTEAAKNKIIADLVAIRSAAASEAGKVAESIGAMLDVNGQVIAGNEAAFAAAKERAAQLDAKIKETTASIDKEREALAALGDTGAEATQQIAESAQQAADAVGQVDAAAASAGSATGGYINALQAFITEFMGVSDAALARFVKFQKGTVGVGIPLEKSAARLLEAAAATRAAIGAQQDQATNLGTIFDELANAGDNAADVLLRVGAQGSKGLEEFALAVREGRSSINLLNQADLDALADSAQRAADKIKQIEENSLAAIDGLKDLTESFLDAQAQRDGDLRAIEDRRFQDDLRRIEELAAAGGAAAAAAAAEARRLAEIEHRARLAEIEAEARAKKKANGDGTEDRPPSPTRPNNGGGNGGGSGAAGAMTYHITINSNGTTEEQARQLIKEIERIQRRSR
ncbi:MAG: hypothetical protein E6Q97_06120 [Desulfurellales bacterium]|nr:MAG: hypothetical protein E6Q97_06120 [Desulfurellales bacterium]